MLRTPTWGGFQVLSVMNKTVGEDKWTKSEVLHLLKVRNKMGICWVLRCRKRSALCRGEQTTVKDTIQWPGASWWLSFVSPASPVWSRSSDQNPAPSSPKQEWSSLFLTALAVLWRSWHNHLLSWFVPHLLPQWSPSQSQGPLMGGIKCWRKYKDSNCSHHFKSSLQQLMPVKDPCNWNN